MKRIGNSAIWWGEATDEPLTLRFDTLKPASEDARPAEIPKQYHSRKIALVLLCTALFRSGVSAAPSRVSVKDNHFVTADGQTIVFRGLDTSDPDKLERNGQWNKHYFEVAKSWGANVVRIPVHPAAWHIHGKKNYLKLLDQGVKWAKEEGLYVIIDWHSIGNLHEEKFFPGSSELYPATIYNTIREETFDFWKTMAKHYRGNNTRSE